MSRNTKDFSNSSIYRHLVVTVACDTTTSDRLYSGTYHAHVPAGQSISASAGAAVRLIEERTNIRDLHAASIRVFDHSGKEVKVLDENGSIGDYGHLLRDYAV